MTGYCQRGVAELAEDRPLDDVLALVERSCALAGTAHRTALCMAVESAANVTPGKTVRVARVLFAEVERMLARLWLLGEAGRAANVPIAVADALAQREMLLEATETITGERTFWGIAVPGGVRPDLGMKPLRDAFERFESSVASWRRMVSPQGSLGRAGKGVATLSAETVDALGLTSLAAFGSRERTDLRQMRLYGGYADLDLDEDVWPTQHGVFGGDVAARLAYTVEEIASAQNIALACLDALAEAGDILDEPKALPPASISRNGHAEIEGPHGPVSVALTLTSAGHISELQLETPGAATIPALPTILEGQTLALVPLILASLDLCLECHDQ
ncbi:MAG: NADH-quinone oxidoreductase subunit D-related protein [Ktedonobacterales bacterium]